MEETQNNKIVSSSPDSSGETFEQKIIRNVREGGFAVYKTPEVVGGKTMLANIEWEDPDQVDKFFAFAKSLSAKVIYVTESEEEEDPTTGQIKTGIAQVGFIYEGIMHNINLDDEDDEEEYEDDDEYDESDEEDGEEYEDDDETEGEYETAEEQTQIVQKPIQQNPQVQQQVPPSNVPNQPQQNPQPTWPKPQF